MKSNLLTKVRLLSFMALLLMVGVSCSDSDSEEPSTLVIKNESVDLNKLGLNERGNIVEVNIVSNVYWQSKVTQGDAWLKTNVSGGIGDIALQILADRNDGAVRTGSITLELIDGSTGTISVTQIGGDSHINYVLEQFDEKEVDMMSIMRYGETVSWAPTGLGSAALVFRGTETTLIDSSEPSAGYEGASGAGNVLFSKANSTFEFGPISTKGNHAFSFSFGSKSTEATFDKSKLKFMLSLNGTEWREVPYTRSNKAAWDIATVNFQFMDEVPRIYYRIESTVDNVYRVDDVSLSEGVEGEGVAVDFNVVIDDGKPVGFLYMNDDFSWVTVGTDWIANPSAPSHVEVRFDESAVDKMTPEQRASLSASGWTTSVIYAYLRLGYIKLGKTSAGGDLVSKMLTDITPGSIVNAKLTFDVSMYASAGGTPDVDGIVVEVMNGGTIDNVINTQKTIKVGSWNSWKTISIDLLSITADTQIRFASARMNETNRFFIDNVKVAKVVKN